MITTNSNFEASGLILKLIDSIPVDNLALYQAVTNFGTMTWIYQGNCAFQKRNLKGDEWKNTWKTDHDQINAFLVHHS